MFDYAAIDILALLLPGDGRVRFIPKLNFNGTVQLFYRAWDQSAGTVGGALELPQFALAARAPAIETCAVEVEALAAVARFVTQPG